MSRCKDRTKDPLRRLLRVSSRIRTKLAIDLPRHPSAVNMATSGDSYNQSRVSSVYGGTISLVAAATLAVGLRFVARGMTAAKYWWDDWILVLALVNLSSATE